MIVSEAIDLVKTSELRQLSVKDDKPALIGFINMGILELYKRFVLWQAEAVINAIPGTEVYLLDGIDPNVTIDLSDHEILTIDEAYDSIGDVVRINDEQDPYGIVTPKHAVVEMIDPEVATTFALIYRASPKFLTHEKAPIPLAPQFYEALFKYVGFLAHGGNKGHEKEENNSHYKRFEQSCNRIKVEGLYVADSLHAHKFVDRGFV